MLGHQNAPFQRRFARIVAGQDRREMFVPLIGKINPALLHPAVEIGLRDFVRRVQCRMIGGEESDRRLLIGHAVIRDLQIEWRHFRLQPIGPIVLHDHVAAGFDKGEQRWQGARLNRSAR